MSNLDTAIERIVDEHVRRALAQHQCQCACAAKPDTPRRTAYTVPEVAELIRITEEQVRALCVRGEMDSFYAGRYIRIPVEAVEAFKRLRPVARAS